MVRWFPLLHACSSVSSFRDLKAWQHARRLALACVRMTKRFPANEQDKGGLADQLRRAAFSVALNIAEGHNRVSNRDRRKFYEVARTSLDEVAAILILCGDADYVSEDQLAAANAIQVEAAKTLYGLLREVICRLEAGELRRVRRARTA